MPLVRTLSRMHWRPELSPGDVTEESEHEAREMVRSTNAEYVKTPPRAAPRLGATETTDAAPAAVVETADAAPASYGKLKLAQLRKLYEERTGEPAGKMKKAALLKALDDEE